MISPYPGRGGGGLASGVAPYTASLVEALADEGLSVHVVAPVAAGEPTVEQRGRVVVERGYRPGPLALPQAALAAARTGAKVVHLQHETFLFGGTSSIPGLLPALGILRSGGRRSVVTLHQVVDPGEVDQAFTRLHRVHVPPAAARWGLRGQQGSIRLLSTATVVHAARFAELVPGSFVVPIGLTRRRPEPAAEARQALELPNDALVALCFGFVAPYKGLEVALEAARVAGPAVHLVVAGGPHPRLAGNGDGYAADLEARYQEVARFTGFVPAGDVRRWFSAADVVLLPYPRPFAGSAAFAEALAYGAPVLCSPALAACLGLPREVVAPVDPSGLADRLVCLAEDRTALAELGAIVEGLAVGSSWRDVARRHLAIYAGRADAR